MDVPDAAEPARPIITDLDPSPALSILMNGPNDFAGRKIGVMVSDGTDAKLLAALQAAAKKHNVLIELVAPKVGGFETSDGEILPAKQKINGGPSVLYDAVALLVSEEGAELLKGEATARDFIADAFAHAKFIAYAETAQPLLDKAGVEPDGGFLALSKPADAERFIKLCAKLRFWEREASVHAV
jgi:catalase